MVAGKKTITANAAGAAEAALAEPTVSASTECCAAGQQAFDTSESVLAAEYNDMVEALQQAQAALAAQAEANQNAWTIAEQQIQTWAGVPSNQLANMAAQLMIAEGQLSESQFEAAESALNAEIDQAQNAIGSAENVLLAESQWFAAEAGCAEAESGAETETGAEAEA